MIPILLTLSSLPISDGRQIKIPHCPHAGWSDNGHLEEKPQRNTDCCIGAFVVRSAMHHLATDLWAALAADQFMVPNERTDIRMAASRVACP